jgi:hypothetical protein
MALFQGVDEVAGGDGGGGGGIEASMRESLDRVSRLEEQAAQLAQHLTAKEDMIGVSCRGDMDGGGRGGGYIGRKLRRGGHDELHGQSLTRSLSCSPD